MTAQDLLEYDIVDASVLPSMLNGMPAPVFRPQKPSGSTVWLRSTNRVSDASSGLFGEFHVDEGGSLTLPDVEPKYPFDFHSGWVPVGSDGIPLPDTARFGATSTLQPAVRAMELAPTFDTAFSLVFCEVPCEPDSEGWYDMEPILEGLYPGYGSVLSGFNEHGVVEFTYWPEYKFKFLTSPDTNHRSVFEYRWGIEAVYEDDTKEARTFTARYPQQIALAGKGGRRVYSDVNYSDGGYYYTVKVPFHSRKFRLNPVTWMQAGSGYVEKSEIQPKIAVVGFSDMHE